MQCVTVLGMTNTLGSNSRTRFSEAVVSEIKAEMGRRGLSSRALGRLIGENSQYMSMRLDGGNPRTGKKVTLSITDLAAIASALELDPDEFLRRAMTAALNDREDLQQ